MHSFDEGPTSAQLLPNNGPWYRELNSYHWFVLIVAALGWLFDCFDQQIFLLSIQPAMRELLSKVVDGKIVEPSPTTINAYSGYATSIFLMGWASGGLLFGILGDRIGRARTMLITILLYSLFTGLSALSQSFWDFSIFRFLTGLGVGGEFAVGVALVAEVMPARARPYALSSLQALSAIGNISAALITMMMGQMFERDMVSSIWRPVYVIGAVPALLALVIRRRLKEPEKWQKASHSGAVKKQLGSYALLFSDPRWRKHALIGLGLAFAGVVGLWAVGFFSMSLVGDVLRKRFTAQGMSGKTLDSNLAFWRSMTSIMINLGAAAGMFGFGFLTQRIGRKPSFAISFVAALVSTIAMFALMNDFWHIFVLAPIMGFCQLSLFAGYAIYFPELFPTHLRSTGTSFCYNVGRFVAALGPTTLGLLTSQVFADTEEPLRYAGLTMTSIFLVGLLVLPFAPETRNRPLPE